LAVSAGQHIQSPHLPGVVDVLVVVVDEVVAVDGISDFVVDELVVVDIPEDDPIDSQMNNGISFIVIFTLLLCAVFDSVLNALL